MGLFVGFGYGADKDKGLVAGDKVIVSPLANIRDGMPVREALP